MDINFERAVNAELLPGETLLWSGQPKLSRLFTATDWFLVPFSLAGSAFGIWFVVSMLTMHFIMLLFAIIYIPMVLYMVAGRFLAKSYYKKRTVYALTDLRVLRLTLGSEGRKKKGMSADLAGIEKESVSSRRDGCGSIFFGNVPIYSKLFMNTGMEYMPGYHVYDGLVFFDVDKVNQVFEIYKNAKLACRHNGEPA